jgi:dTDP-4-dehydrorhamnose 3,5-epimerase
VCFLSGRTLGVTEDARTIMKLETLPSGCYIFEGKVFSDNRGDTLCYRGEPFDTHTIRQSMTVTNKLGTVRGMHCAQYAKQVVCLDGEIYDVLVDMRKDSSTYGDWIGVTLAGSESLFVPAGIAHGYISLKDSRVLYSLEGSWTETKRDGTLYWKDPTVGIEWPESRDVVISEKDNNPSNTFSSLVNSIYGTSKTVLVYGWKGYLGQHAVKELEEYGWSVLLGETRCDDHDSTYLEIQSKKPDVIFCTVGRSGSPTAVWHDNNPAESIQNNLEAVVSLCRACSKLNKRVVVFGTGFVFSGGSDENPIKDDDKHFPDNTMYCHMRSITEKILSDLGNVLTLRVNYPTTPDKDPRGMFGKLSGAAKVHESGSSVTVVHSLFPYLGKILESDRTGAINFVNKGSASPKDFTDVMGLSPKVSSPTSVCVCVLDTKGLESIVGPVQHVKDALYQAWKTWERSVPLHV